MMLNINSPAYYTNKFGVQDEIYKMCSRISLYVKEKQYSKYIDIIGIVPIIIPKEIKEMGMYKEEKNVRLNMGLRR